MSSRSQLPSELEAPSHARHLRFSPVQWVAIPVLLLLIPILALAGVFGETSDRAEASTATLDLRVAYKDRYRYKQINTVEVSVQNRTKATLDTLVVAFDPAYVRKFSTLAFIPSATEPFEVELLELKPGDVKQVWAELQGERYGSHSGYVKVYAKGGTDTAAVTIQTTVYP